MRSPVSIVMSHPFVYTHVTRILRGHKTIQEFVDTYVRPTEGCRFLDIGCGPGDILNFLPPVEYYGFDQDESYIASAQNQFKDRGKFFCRLVSRDAFAGDSNFDIILAMGILHHLDDNEAAQLFELAHHLLKPGGRLITYDGCYTPDQSRAQKFFLDIDRGKFVRNEKEYTVLAKRQFPGVTTTVRPDLLNIPYNIIIMECRK